MIYWTWTQKIFELPWCNQFDFEYIGLGLEKCLDNLPGVMILWYYVTELGLILLYVRLGLIKWNNQADMPIEKYEDFLE